MGMFDALIPQEQEIDLGSESYEEIVDSYCLALEDVEGEISGLESLGDAIDNADAFAAAIESCGGSVSPALMQFGYAVDPAFGQLIGRECPSDFATENMEEFGSFALESIKSKLVVAWEAVKNFIIRLWEKIKEFCRWVLRLFDRKKQRLEAIVKAAEAKVKKGKDEVRKPENKKIKAFDKAKMTEFIGKVSAAYGNPEGWVITESSKQVGNKVAQAAKDPLIMVGWKFANVGGFENMTKSGSIPEQDFNKLGFSKFSDIGTVAKLVVDLLSKRADVEKAAKVMDKSKQEAEAFKNTMAKFDDPADKDTDKKDKDEIREADKAKAAKLILCRRNALLRSKLVVTLAKEVNNVAASIIQIAGIAGL